MVLGARYYEDRGFFDNQAYEAEIREEVMARESSVFALTFCQERRYMLAGSNTGRLAIWEIKPHLYPTERPQEDSSSHPWEEPTRPGRESWRQPLKELEARRYPAHLVAKKGYPTLSYQVSNRALNSIVFAGDLSGAVLVIGGDDGIFLWQWSTIRALLVDHHHDSSTTPSQQAAAAAAGRGGGWRGVVPPLQCIRAVGYSRRFPYLIESSMIAVDRANHNIFYSAGGDSIVRSWDLGSKLSPDGHRVGEGAADGKGHTGPVAAVCSVSGQSFVSGGDDGRVMLWDMRQPHHFVRAADAWKEDQNSNKTAAAALGGQVVPSYGPAHVRWVSAVDVDANGDWLACGGGAEVASSSQNNKSSTDRSGFVSLLHLPSLMSIKVSSCSSFVQDVRFNAGGDKITSVGSEPVVSHWSRGGLERVGKASTAMSSIFAIGIRDQPPSSSVTSTCCFGGASDRLEYFVYPDYRTFSLTFR